MDVVEVKGRRFKVEDKELDAEKIGRITLDDKITFSGTLIDYDGVKTTYALNNDVIYSADGKEVSIDYAATEIYFDGVKISGNSGEIVFDLTNDKISIPSGATLNVTSSDEIKLNLAVGSYTVNGNEISSDNELELAADKDNIKVPLGNAPVTINSANITGSDAALIDNDKTIALPDGAFVQNTSENLFKSRNSRQ